MTVPIRVQHHGVGPAVKVGNEAGPGAENEVQANSIAAPELWHRKQVSIG
ncbi:hypothetical protein [Methyloceanibacter caenitepidi]|nr:hypothetical protein [Methyloceanibacter caenitepidi]